MLLAEQLRGLSLAQMKQIVAAQADFNGKVVCSPEAHVLLHDTMVAAGEIVYGPWAPLAVEIPAEGYFADGRACAVQVWLLGSTSAIPVNQR